MLLISRSQKLRKILEHVFYRGPSSTPVLYVGGPLHPLLQLHSLTELLEVPFEPQLAVLDADCCTECDTTQLHGVFVDASLFRLLHPRTGLVLTARDVRAPHVVQLANALRMFCPSTVGTHADLARSDWWRGVCACHQVQREMHGLDSQVRGMIHSTGRQIAEASHVHSLMQVAPYFPDVKRAVRFAYWPTQSLTYAEIARALRRSQQVNAKTLVDATRVLGHVRLRESGMKKEAKTLGLDGDTYRRHLRQSGKITLTDLRTVTGAQATAWFAELITTPQPSRLTFSAALERLV